MSHLEDMEYDAFDCYDFHEKANDYWDETWIELKSSGYIWQDKYCNDYKPKDLSDCHLMAIINFCKKVYRPKEQVEALEKLAEEKKEKENEYI